MFGNLNLDGVPSINSYSKALMFFTRTKPWRGSSDSIRPMHRSRRRHMEMRRMNDDSIAFRLYQTDVVTWHPDNSITINPYPSNTTDKFASPLLPDGVYPKLNSALGTCVEIGGYWVRIERNTRLQLINDQWEVTEGAQPITVPRLDYAKAREALRTSRWKDFMAWRKAFVALGGKVDPDYFWPGTHEAYEMLAAGPERWMELHRKLFSPQHEDQLKYAIYNLNGCIDKTEFYKLHYTEILSVVRARRVYHVY